MHKTLSKLPPYLLTIIVTAAILYLTLVPKPLPDNDMMLIPGMDKIVHALMFGGFTLVLALDSSRRRPGLPAISRSSLVIFAVTAVIFGGTIEILQQLMDMGRGGDILDFIADTCGAVIFATIANPIIDFLRRH